MKARLPLSQSSWRERWEEFSEHMDEPIITGWRLLGWSISFLIGSIVMNFILFFIQRSW